MCSAQCVETVVLCDANLTGSLITCTCIQRPCDLLRTVAEPVRCCCICLPFNVNYVTLCSSVDLTACGRHAALQRHDALAGTAIDSHSQAQRLLTCWRRFWFLYRGTDWTDCFGAWLIWQRGTKRRVTWLLTTLVLRYATSHRRQGPLYLLTPTMSKWVTGSGRGLSLADAPY